MAEIQNIKISNIECIEIKTISGRRKYFLTDVAESLKGKKVVDIVHIDGNNLKFSPSGNSIYNETLTAGYLTLSANQKEVIKDYPLRFLSPLHFSVRPSFNDIKPEWSKSYITLNGDVVAQAGASILLYVMFND
jgi:hypothetical protein